MLRRFRPIQALGSGGFSKTYLAEDVERFNDRCVIKQFAPNVQGTAGLQVATRLFEEEARRLQQLGEHPQIPTLLAYFEQDQRLYLVQQYIEGQNLLDELQQQGTFNEPKIRKLLIDLLNVLQVVHQQKVIHRDIKPENIIHRRTPQPLFSRGVGGNLVLIDFGASKQLTATAIATPKTMIGSFGYVPMEQMQGGEAYPSSDLYSLGATCFHLLTGIAPWELWKKQGYGWVQGWRQHLPQPVSEELGRILDKLLQEDYERRYQSAEEVLADLNLQPLPQQKVSPTVVLPPQPSPQQPNTTPTITVQPLALIRTLTGHSDSVNCVAISPNGQTLASGSEDNTIKIWNLPTGQVIRTLTGHSDSVSSLAISPNGQTLASGSDDETIKIWNLSTGQEIRTLTGHSSSVWSVAISPNGQTLASGSHEKTIKIWSLSSGKVIRSLTGHSNTVSSLAFSPGGQTLASGSLDNTIKIWNLSTGQVIRTLTGHSYWVDSVAFSPDGQTLASGSFDKTIKIWNLSSGKVICSLTGHSDWVRSVAFSPDGQILASGSDNTIKIWNLSSGKVICSLTGHPNWGDSAAFRPDEQTLASGSFDKTGHSDDVKSVAFSPDGQILASGSFDNTIKIWRLAK